MAVITIKRKMNFPLFVARKWRKSDHDRPLRFQLAIAKACIYFEEKRPYEKDLIGFPSGRIELIYDPALGALLTGLRSKGYSSTQAAQMIYDAYLEVNKKLNALLYSVGKVRNLPQTPLISITNFFNEHMTLGEPAVEWRLDAGPFEPFIPKLPKPRGINPLFKAEQIITPARWDALQKVADAGDFPDGEVLELYKITALHL